MGARKITVSTAGDVKGIDRFGDEDWQVRLSVSLHSANNELRSKLVPFNRKYPLEKLRESLETFSVKTGRQFTFEWTLLDQVNDTPEAAKEFLAYAEELPAFVNLIRGIRSRGSPIVPSPIKRCEAFRDMLVRGGLKATLRQEKGQDIEAACGQLRRVEASKKATPAD